MNTPYFHSPPKHGQNPVIRATLAAFADGFTTNDDDGAPAYSFGRIKTEILSGLTVALALVPEAVAFAFVAGVHPLVGLYAAFIVGLITALIGGRPGMISGATGALAVVMVALVAAHGVEYLFATVVLMGIMQILAGVFHLGKFIRLVPHPVMMGFVNGLAIVIFLAQLTQFQVPGPDGVKVWMTGWPLIYMLGLVALTMAIIWLVPKITTVIPAPLAGILVVVAIVIAFGIDVPRVGDLASIKGGLPGLPYSHGPADAGNLADHLPLCRDPRRHRADRKPADAQPRRRNHRQERRRLAGMHRPGRVQHRHPGFFGGMGGCAMIGQSMINMKSGGRTRMSGISAALFLLVFILVASSLIEQIPLAALVGVMFMVVIGTFAWQSVTILKRIPLTDALVMFLVTIVTGGSRPGRRGRGRRHRLRAGLCLEQRDPNPRPHPYHARRRQGLPDRGAAVLRFDRRLRRILQTGRRPRAAVIVDFDESRVVDQSALQAIEALAMRYEAEGKSLQLRHLSHDCHQLLNRAGQLIVDSDDDPNYGIAVDYNVKTGILGGGALKQTPSRLRKSATTVCE